MINNLTLKVNNQPNYTLQSHVRKGDKNGIVKTSTKT